MKSPSAVPTTCNIQELLHKDLLLFRPLQFLPYGHAHQLVWLQGPSNAVRFWGTTRSAMGEAETPQIFLPWAWDIY